MRRVFSIILLILSSFCSFGQEFLSDTVLAHASVSIFIADTKTGEIVMEYNPEKSLAPASVMKLITSAAALELFGPEYRFNTILGYTGSVSKGGKLTGDIVIKGGGDPVFGSKNFPDYYLDFPDKWTEEIKKLGIKKINGRVITDDSYYDFLPVPAKWLWEDAGNYYGAGAYGASVFDNTYEIHFQTFADSSQTFITEIIPAECRFELTNRLVAAGTTDQGYVFAAPYSTNGWLAGSIPGNRADFVLKASITDPPLLIAKMMDEKLKAAGITISGEPTTVRLEKGKPTDPVKPVLVVNSPPLSEIIEILNHESVNLYAEHLVKEMGKKFMNSGSTAAGIDVVYSFLDSAGADIDGMFIEDGSGLSTLNSINTKGLVTLLIYMKNNGKYFEDYLNSFPDAGKEGTMKSYFRDDIFATRLKAKSGSMTRVRSYAGYLTTNSGKELAFAVIVNDFTGPSRNVATLIEGMLKEVILE